VAFVGIYAILGAFHHVEEIVVGFCQRHITVARHG
jgi:hypothetical protein